MTRVILLAGERGSGKDTVGDMIRDEMQSVVTLAFADPIKEGAQLFFENVSPEISWIGARTLWGCSDKRERVFSVYGDQEVWGRVERRMQRHVESWLRQVLRTADPDVLKPAEDSLWEWFWGLKREALEAGGLSTRRVLQTLGTDWGRAHNPTMWIDYHMAQVDRLVLDNRYNAIVTTDGRMINEAEAFDEREDGEIWFLVNPRRKKKKEEEKHATEIEMLSPEFQKTVDVRIEKDGLDALRAEVRHALHKRSA